MAEELSYTERVLAGYTEEELGDVQDEEQELSAVKTKTNAKPVQTAQKNPTREVGGSQKRLQVVERVGQLPAEIQKGLANGTYQLSDKVHYAVVNFANWSNSDIIRPDAGKQTGTNSFAQGKIDNFFLCQGVKIVFDATSATGQFIDDVPTGVLNGDVSLSVNSREKFGNLPVLNVISHNGYPTNRDYNKIDLDNPKWFEALKDISAKLNLATAQTTGFLKVMFLGTEVKPA